MGWNGHKFARWILLTHDPVKIKNDLERITENKNRNPGDLQDQVVFFKLSAH